MGEKDGGDNDFIKWFSELNGSDIGIIGLKSIGISEMYKNKFNVPDGFIISSKVFDGLLKVADADNEIENMISGIKDFDDFNKLNEVSEKIRKKIEEVNIDGFITEQIYESYDILDVDKRKIENARGSALEILKKSHEPLFVAVRSSVIPEKKFSDLSFSGIHETVLNVKGQKELIKAVKKVFSSLYTSKAIYYRAKKGIETVKMAVIVQRMIDSERAGTICTKEKSDGKTELNFESIFGSGEGLVSGIIKPDKFIVENESGKFEILESKISDKKYAIKRDSSGQNEVIKMSEEKSKSSSLNNYEIKKLANQYYFFNEKNKSSGLVEYSISGEEVYAIQFDRNFGFEKKDKISGNAKIIRYQEDLDKIEEGDILVSDIASTELVFGIAKSSGMVFEKGGESSNVARLLRDFGIPGVFYAENVSEDFIGKNIVLDSINQKVYPEEMIKKEKLGKTKTKIRINNDLSEKIKKTFFDSIGLLEIENIFKEEGKHPLYFLNKTKDYEDLIYSKIKDSVDDFNDIRIRTLKMRSDENSDLEGGNLDFQNNPLIGNHGIRFGLENKKLLEAELNAVGRISKEFNKKNISIVIPRVVDKREVEEVKEMIISQRLNIEVGVSIDTPASVQIINELCETGIKFVVVNLQELVQHTLSADIKSKAYNENSQAVLNSLRYVIRRCKKYDVESCMSINNKINDSLLEFLLQEGIDSISVNYENSFDLNEKIINIENKLGIKNDKIIKEENQDIEQIILKELETDDYNPGYSEHIDVPKLNDAIPIDSEHFELGDKIREFQ